MYFIFSQIHKLSLSLSSVKTHGMCFSLCALCVYEWACGKKPQQPLCWTFSSPWLDSKKDLFSPISACFIKATFFFTSFFFTITIIITVSSHTHVKDESSWSCLTDDRHLSLWHHSNGHAFEDQSGVWISLEEFWSCVVGHFSLSNIVLLHWHGAIHYKLKIDKRSVYIK